MHTENRNLTWTPMLLLLSGVLCSEWRVEYQQKNICAVKGSSVVFPCSFYYPDKHEIQSVKWSHGRNNIYTGPFIFDSESNNTPIRFQYIGDRHHNCSFKIHQVGHNDRGKYAFRFSTKYKDGPVQGWTGIVGSTINVVDLMVLVTKSNGNETVKEGDSVNLTCINRCDSGGVSSAFTWFKNGEPQNGPVLYLSNISSTNSGNYTCSLMTQTRTTSGVITIDVEYGPKNTSVFVRPSTEVDAGSNITLICSSNANPPAENYSWFKIGDDDMIFGNGPELNFREIYPDDGGQYLCSVTNKHGSQNSSIVTINVKAHWPTFTRDVLIIATVATLLIVITVIAIRRFNKKSTSAPKTTPETDCVEDMQNTIYVNWPVFENSQSQEENRCEGVTTELVYATVDFNTKRKSNTQQQMDSHNNDEGVIYSTVCRDQILNLSYIEPL